MSAQPASCKRPPCQQCLYWPATQSPQLHACRREGKLLCIDRAQSLFRLRLSPEADCPFIRPLQEGKLEPYVKSEEVGAQQGRWNPGQPFELRQLIWPAVLLDAPASALAGAVLA